MKLSFFKIENKITSTTPYYSLDFNVATVDVAHPLYMFYNLSFATTVPIKKPVVITAGYTDLMFIHYHLTTGTIKSYSVPVEKL